LNLRAERRELEYSQGNGMWIWDPASSANDSLKKVDKRTLECLDDKAL